MKPRDSRREDVRRPQQGGLKPLDYLVFGVVVLTALALVALRICPVDWLWATATILVVALWAWTIHRKSARSKTNRQQETRYKRSQRI